MSPGVQSSTSRGAPGLWAITCYFNPVGYRRRLDNYHTFRQRLAVPLVTVELSFDASFQLRENDADVLVQLRGRDVMWQKERLLNVALNMVPEDCRHIAWLDCDVVFEKNDWADRAILALDQFALLRLFDARHDLSAHETPRQLTSQDKQPPGAAFDQDSGTGEGISRNHLPAAVPLSGHNSPGLAWAARRNVLAERGLYDACILGSGDRSILCAALGEFDYIAKALRMNARRSEHYRAWAMPFFEAVHGRVGCLPGGIFHLWHGDRNDREYRKRQGRLEEFDFDPYTDIAVDSDGCWRWSSDKPDLHESVRRYFESRKEDGAADRAMGMTAGLEEETDVFRG